MKEKTLTIEIPEGYDDAELVDNKIVFKKEQKTPWRQTNPKVEGYYINSNSCLCMTFDAKWNEANENVFATTKQAKSMLAMAQLSQIIQNDKRFGGSITDNEWGSTSATKYTITRSNNAIKTYAVNYDYEFLAFHTAEQRDLFLEENRDLIEQYFMIDNE